MASTKLVTLVNQTGKPMVLNLAPVSMGAPIHLPARGRIHVNDDLLKAYEIAGALSARPPRLMVIDAPVTSAKDAKPAAAESKPSTNDSAKKG